MAMVDLALYCQEKPAVLSDIADRQGLSTAYLEQLFLKLRRASLVASVRGPGGGYLLGREAADISIGQIIQAVGENIIITRCPNNLAQQADILETSQSLQEPKQVVNGCMPDNSQCITHHLWWSLGQHMQRFLDDMSLADVISQRSQN